MCMFPKLQSAMLPFTYVCLWKCYTSIKALFFLFTKFHNTKLRTVPHGTVRKVRLVRIFMTRTNVPYLSNNYVPYKRTVLFTENWNVPYLRTVPYCHPCSTLPHSPPILSRTPPYLLYHLTHTKISHYSHLLPN